MMGGDPLVEELLKAIPNLSHVRLEVLSRIARAFDVPIEWAPGAGSDFMIDELAQAFGDVLIVHHVLSSEAFTKDKFEHALVNLLNQTGHVAELAPRGNPGHDLSVDDVKWSLKTQADRTIKEDRIHISKFMELGKGKWDDEADLEGLRDRMFSHMEGYDRIFVLRCLSASRQRQDNDELDYELVEIPKGLLAKSISVPCVMQMNSTQTPKPGTCTVKDENGETEFQLYFDGGTERKLQIRELRTAKCVLHGTWKFKKPV